MHVFYENAKLISIFSEICADENKYLNGIYNVIDDDSVRV